MDPRNLTPQYINFLISLARRKMPTFVKENVDIYNSLYAEALYQQRQAFKKGKQINTNILIKKLQEVVKKITYDDRENRYEVIKKDEKELIKNSHLNIYSYDKLELKNDFNEFLNANFEKKERQMLVDRIIGKYNQTELSKKYNMSRKNVKMKLDEMIDFIKQFYKGDIV